jgi:hypothetical protein
MATTQSRLEGGSNEPIQLNSPPKLGQLVEELGWKEGISRFDTDMEQWFQDLRKQMADSFQLKNH